MGTSELKENIRKALENTSDSDILKLVYDLLSTSQSEVVGYEGKRKITKLELLKRALEAENDYELGKTMTVEEAKEKFNRSGENE